MGIPLVALLIGIYLVFSDPKSIVRRDGKTGYYIYKNTLKASGDEEKAIRAAGVYYKIVGSTFIVLSSLFLIAILGCIIAEYKEKTSPNQRVEPIVTTPVESGNAQSTQAHP